ncbi:X protein [Orthohepadnavirus magnimyotis]|nr:X protein [Longquan Myotis chinensis orthohepadnavirus 1]
MAARLHCTLDPSRDVLLLRAFGTQPGGRAITGSLGIPLLAAASPVPAVDRPHLAMGRIPACATSSRGPCALHFTSADISRCMAAPVTGLPKWLCARTLGLRVQGHDTWTVYLGQQILVEWEELGYEARVCTFVSGGCRHKLL